MKNIHLLRKSLWMTTEEERVLILAKKKPGNQRKK